MGAAGITSPIETSTSNRRSMVEPQFSPQERDIDLLLMQEVSCNLDFLLWFCDRAGLTNIQLASARHSVYRDHGETDVLLTLNSPDGILALMIEDKIGAPMQRDQALRYRQRGELLVASGEVAQFRTMLFAPSSYIESVPASDWDCFLSFEDAAARLLEQDDRRGNWAGAILIKSAARVRRAKAIAEGTTPIRGTTADAIVNFKKGYWERLRSAFPEFRATLQSGSAPEYLSYSPIFGQISG